MRTGLTPSTVQWCRCGRFRGRNLADSVAVRRRFRAGVGVFCQTLINYLHLGFPTEPIPSRGRLCRFGWSRSLSSQLVPESPTACSHLTLHRCLLPVLQSLMSSMEHAPPGPCSWAMSMKRWTPSCWSRTATLLASAAVSRSFPRASRFDLPGGWYAGVSLVRDLLIGHDHVRTWITQAREAAC